MNELFDKPLDEIREAFVHNRFAEPDMFGRSDIEDLTVRVGCYDKPFFLRYLSHRFAGAQGRYLRESVLRSRATSKLKTPAGFKNDSRFNKHYWQIIDLMQAGGAEIFYPIHSMDSWPIVFMPRDSDHLRMIYVLRPTLGVMSIALVEAEIQSDILAVIIAELGVFQQKNQKAYRWLERSKKASIQLARQTAENDFDEAVAVSIDGTKIVKADWVFVIGNGYQTGTLFRADAFRKQKIRIFSPHDRITVGRKQGSDTRTYLSWFLTIASRFTGGATHLVTDPDNRIPTFGSVYVVDSNIDPQRLPSPLPKAGTEVRRS